MNIRKSLSLIAVLHILSSVVSYNCNNLQISNMEQYNNISNCHTVDILTISNLDIKNINISLSYQEIIIENCYNLESVTISQKYANYPSSIIGFVNNSRLTTYIITVNVTTYVYFNNQIYPSSFNLSPPSLLNTLEVYGTNWNDFSVFKQYTNILGIQLSYLTEIRDLSILQNNKFTASVSLVSLPNLESLSFLKNTITTTTIYLYQLSIITLEDMNSLQKTNSFVVDQLLNLTDISALQNLKSSAIIWNNDNNICCPDFTTGMYDNLISIPNCRDCFSVESIMPMTGPIEGGIIVDISYNGPIRSNVLHIKWGQNAISCNAANNIISCVIPSISEPQEVVLEYSFNNIMWKTLNMKFKYIIWQNLILDRVSTEQQSYNSINIPDLLPEDNSQFINNAIIAIWITILCLTVILFIVYIIFTLPRALDIINMPVNKNLGMGLSLYANEKNSLGAFFSITTSLILIGILISSSLSFTLNNKWGATSLISPQNKDADILLKVELEISPGNICNDSNLLYTPLTDVEFDVSVDTCFIRWKTSSIDVIFSVVSNLWSSYAYSIKYSVSALGSNSNMFSTVEGLQISNSSSLLKGNVGEINLVSTINLLDDTDVGAVFRLDSIVPIENVGTEDFLEQIQLGININIRSTEYWQGTYIQTTQSNLAFIAELFALCSGALSIVKFIMNTIAKLQHRRSNSPDIEITLKDR